MSAALFFARGVCAAVGCGFLFLAVVKLTFIFAAAIGLVPR